jgi:putative phosphoribosyl transferase
MEAYRYIYEDRFEAGRELAGHLLEYADSPDVVVLGLAGGGMPVAFVLARILRLPLDVLVADWQQDFKARMYRSGRRAVDVQGKQVIVVDDGLTGESVLRSALRGLRMAGPDRIIVAVPAASSSRCSHLGHAADAIVCPLLMDSPVASGTCYEHGAEVSDDEVRALLKSRV